MKKYFSSLLLFGAFIFMLILSDATKTGALNGLRLWLFTLVPTLLPFMIISSIIMETGSYGLISRLLKPVMRFLFRLPEECGYPFFVGLFCGFPMGSKVTADMIKAGKLSPLHGNILLTFCNNISPPFVISYLTSYVLKLSGGGAVMVNTVMLLSPVLNGILFSRLLPSLCKASPSAKAQNDTIPHIPPQKGRNIFDICILKSFENITKLGGYIILFTVLCSILRLFIRDSFMCCTLLGLFEITSGLDSFQSLAPTDGRIIAACALAAFGGFCSAAQTYSMIHGSGLRLSVCLFGKIVNSLIVIALLYLAMLIHPYQ